MNTILILILVIYANTTQGNFTSIAETNLDVQRIDIIVDIITLNLKKNGWNTVMFYGNLPDEFYKKIQHIMCAFIVMNLNDPDDIYIDDIVPYHSNVILINCQDFKEYEELIQKLVTSPYWHPLANIIVYYHTREDKERMAKIFFSLWYVKAINSIIVQYNDLEGTLSFSEYTPYVNENYEHQPDNKFGCWTTRNVGMPVSGYEDGLTCVEKCHNVTLQTKLRANNLGTCIGFNTHHVSYDALKDVGSFNLFEDRSKNFHGFVFRSYTTEVKPFFIINIDNGTYTLHSRDGMIWNTMSQVMNFGIDLTPSMNVMKKPFNFETSINQIFAFARRKGDLCLFPIYQFDIIVVEIDFTFPYRESGVCIMSSRAGFETSIFNEKAIQSNSELIIRFFICFICIWGTFAIYKFIEKGRYTFDQMGKDLMNTFRNVLLINLHNPPKRQSFRIFMAISLWSFFTINFISQATIISLFTAAKRGKEVETFDDVIEKAYPIEGMASPDLILPDTEEQFRIINSRLVYEKNIVGCIDRMSYDPRRFCLIDCSVGRYIERNKLNEKGEQYLHIAEERIHSHYLSIILPKHSPLTDRFNKYMMMIFEAGLIKKWEQYRYTEIKDEVTTKALRMEDLIGVFKVYCVCVGLTFVIFLLEIIIYNVKKNVKKCLESKKYRKICYARKMLRFGKLFSKGNTE